jgi:tetratricopeptide (TPR) repeat protein
LYISPYVRLAQLSAMEQKWKESAGYSDKAISLDPISYPQAYYLSALSHYSMGQLDKAESSVRKGIRLDLMKQIPQMHLILANILTLKSDFSGAVDAMKQYLKEFPDAPDAKKVRTLIEAQKERIRASQTVNNKDHD